MISIILNLLNLFYGIAWYMLVNISVSLINTLKTCDVNINNGKVAKSVVERCLCMGKWLSPWKGREVKADWQTGEWARVGVAQSRTRLKRLSSSSSSSSWNSALCQPFVWCSVHFSEFTLLPSCSQPAHAFNQCFRGHLTHVKTFTKKYRKRKCKQMIIC